MGLTLRDLLEARDVYHVHLAHLSNVVGTAIGRYLIREDDWYASHPPTEHRPDHVPIPKGPRTLFNSVIREWSWPCVLVFVNEWWEMQDFRASPDQMVPRALFLPDGRVIPTCVVLAEQGPAAEPVIEDLSFPESYIGGGYVTLTDVQGRQHVGSIGCLVSDGNLTYALTNRHVTGAGGTPIVTLLRDQKTQIGVASALQTDCRKFTDMYPGWPGGNVQLRLDAGLVAVDELSDWTTQVLGMGPLDELMDLTQDSLTLGFVDSPVTAFGAASGLLQGRVAALFYRYRSVGGADYVTEFLIRPETFDGPGPLTVIPVRCGSGSSRHPTGDRNACVHSPCNGRTHARRSGWNSQRNGRFALAASLSTICRELNVSLVRDWNSGLPETGDVGHYTIGFFACEGERQPAHTHEEQSGSGVLPGERPHIKDGDQEAREERLCSVGGRAGSGVEDPWRRGRTRSRGKRHALRRHGQETPGQSEQGEDTPAAVPKHTGEHHAGLLG